MTNNRAISLTRAVYGLRSTSSQSISEKKLTADQRSQSDLLFYCVLRIHEFKMPTSFFTNPKYHTSPVTKQNGFFYSAKFLGHLNSQILGICQPCWSHVPLIVILHYIHVFVCLLFDCLPIISCPGRKFGRGIRGI